VVVVTFIPPRWTGAARVILDVLKPDPVTGQVLGGPSQRTYIATQMQMITDYSVTGRVADQLGWLSDPTQIARYRKRPSNDTRDFRHYLADSVAQRTRAQVLTGSNIMEIDASASKADDARAIAEAIRRAYMDVSLALRRDDANHNADWYEQQAAKAKVSLDAAQKEVSDFQRTNGIVLADPRQDIDSARLRALAGQGALPPAAQPAITATAADLQLAEVDAQLTQAQKTLGPNHPAVESLRAKRASLATLAAQEKAERTAAMNRARSETISGVQEALTAQKNKVAAEQEKIDRLNQLQQAAELRKAQYEKTQAKAAELRQEAAVSDAQITPLGTATVPANPAWPNIPLVIAGAIVGGLMLGILVAILAELLARRVRGMEELEQAIDAPMLAVIAGPGRARARSTRKLPRQMNWPMRRKAVQG
jgi:uncharacterized protein involved in exopolysaccharide biosynthesis